MSDYKNGKIYKLTSKQTDKIYVGSTIRTLNRRMMGHRTHITNGSNLTSIEILKNDDSIIELIEDYPCNSKKELHEREQHYMDLYKDIIVNKNNTTRFCEHNKPRYRCKECKGVFFCEHNTSRYYCKICNNVKICIGVTSNKVPCKNRAKPDSDYCCRHIPK